MKKIIVFAIIAIVFASCSKEFEERNITYRFERGPKSGVVSYLYEDSLYTENFNVSAVPMKLWEKSLKGRQGDPVYFYLRYKAYVPVSQPDGDLNEFPMMSFKASILVDGKAYKETSQVLSYDTVRVSGTLYYFTRIYGTVPF